MELPVLPALLACPGASALVPCVAGLVGSAAQRSIVSAWLLFAACGVLQVALSYLLRTPLERRWPLLRWPFRQPMATDIVYTFVVRIVLFPFAAYVEYGLVKALVEHWLLVLQWPIPSLLRRIANAVGTPLAGFFAGFVILDCADYWRHRISHRFGWWYGLHTLHHAELQMTFWSDDRSHLLEDIITYVWLFAVAIAIGMPVLQFPFVILGFRFVGSFAHANTRARYGGLGERLLISPQFHRAQAPPG
jgi:sterol desaturase/sphingolipid hydroxylase (fatty acid hydroxylase superfamily)